MGLTAGVAVLGAYSSYKSAKTQQATLRANGQIADNNAQLAEWQASQAIVNGQAAEEGSRLQTAQIYGRQRAGLAASGVDLGYGSATDILASTELLGERDATTIHDNALREAWGYRTEGLDYRNQATLDRYGAGQINPWLSAGTSLLGSASRSGYFGGGDLNSGNSYWSNGRRYGNNDLSGTTRGSGD